MSGEGGIPSNIAKGPVHVAMDAVLNYQEYGQFVKRDEIRAKVSDPDNNYIDLLRELFRVPGPVVDYVAEHWYNSDLNSPLTWWKDKQPIEPTIRHSIIEAIDLAKELPIDTYWLPVGNRNVHPDHYMSGTYLTDQYPFEIILTPSKYQLTRIILTPPSPRPRERTLRRFTQPSNIWVINRSTDLQSWGETKTVGQIAITQLLEQPVRYETPDSPPSPYPR